MTWASYGVVVTPAVAALGGDPFQRASIRRIIMYMSSLMDHRRNRRNLVEDFTSALKRHHIVVADPRSVFAAALEVAGQVPSLTAGEVEFLVGAAGFPREYLDPEEVALASLTIEDKVGGAEDAARSGLTTSEVAALLRRDAANVRRSIQRGDFYATEEFRDRERVLPDWQFVGGKPLPGLRQVLEAFEVRLHPLDLERWMTAHREELGDRSAIEWLSTGGDAQTVASLAAEVGRL